VVATVRRARRFRLNVKAITAIPVTPVSVRLDDRPEPAAGPRIQLVLPLARGAA